MIILPIIFLPSIANTLEFSPSLIPNTKIELRQNNKKQNIELIKIEDEEYMIEKNFYNDESYLRFVGPNNSLNKINYEPTDLVDTQWEYILWNEKIRLQAKKSLDKMWEEFYKKFWIKIRIVSWYRSYEKQLKINQNNSSCVKNNFCAKPGYSEHQLGLAIDIFWLSQEIFEKNKSYKQYYSWLQKNAHKYWWTQSYQKWKNVDGYNIEPWHWRYVWVDLATILYEEKITLSEYVKNKFSK